MEQVIDQTLEILRTQRDQACAWSAVILVCRKVDQSDLWQALPPVDIEHDSFSATQWLSTQLAMQPSTTGLYLGLDTLNMDDGNGTNIGFGGSTACNPALNEQDWIFGKMQFGSPHLIRSLLELREVYSQPNWEDSYLLADYILFLGYSGIILREALNRLKAERDVLVSWGFCEGDNFLLGRKGRATFELICK